MRYDDFSFGGVLASAMGVVVEEQVGYTRPAEIVETVQVPGRSGTLTLHGSGDAPVYDQVIYSPSCYIRKGADRQAIFRWLRGRGRVIFGSMPDCYFEAQLINQIDYSQVWQGEAQGYMAFTPVFACQPYRYLYPETAQVSIASSGSKLVNPGNEPSAPIVTLRGVGDITLTVGSGTVLLNGLTDGIVLDCDAQDAYSLDGTALLNSVMTGDFPTLPPGSSWVSWELGAGADIYGLGVLPRWRSI